MAHLSNLKNGKARAIRFSTLESICAVLECQPGERGEHSDGPDDVTPNPFAGFRSVSGVWTVVQCGGFDLVMQVRQERPRAGRRRRSGTARLCRFRPVAGLGA
ncbi:helix-turn-helix domain-containing protein [Arthrobacter castelli]|uniref:helix-turn-helix domain-containing protein n=1 Tax=Arthrobacter castelli TaxID=271431 RepID=UPI003CCC43F5